VSTGQFRSTSGENRGVADCQFGSPDSLALWQRWSQNFKEIRGRSREIRAAQSRWMFVVERGKAETQGQEYPTRAVGIP